MPTTRQALTIGGISFLTAGLTYCLYFDYKRRNDPNFRKKLLKEQRRLAKQKQAQGSNASRELEHILGAAVAAVNAEPLPTTIEGKETFFMEQVGMGEVLAARMPQGAVPAAIAFFKAYKVYPSPQELMMIYQRTMPPEVFGIVAEMIKLDINQTISAAKSSSSTTPSRLLDPDGPLIEEITSEERALLQALKSGVPPPPSESASSSAKPQSEAPKSSSAASHPASKPTTSPLAEPSSQSMTSGGAAGASQSSNPASENGSVAADSQAGNSFVLVDDDAPAAQATTSEPAEKAVAEDDGIQVEPAAEATRNQDAENSDDVVEPNTDQVTAASETTAENLLDETPPEPVLDDSVTEK